MRVQLRVATLGRLGMYICTAAEGTLTTFTSLVVAEPIGLVPGP